MSQFDHAQRSAALEKYTGLAAARLYSKVNYDEFRTALKEELAAYGREVSGLTQELGALQEAYAGQNAVLLAAAEQRTKAEAERDQLRAQLQAARATVKNLQNALLSIEKDARQMREGSYDE